jgi:hypothetical protein
MKRPISFDPITHMAEGHRLDGVFVEQPDHFVDVEASKGVDVPASELTLVGVHDWLAGAGVERGQGGSGRHQVPFCSLSLAFAVQPREHVGPGHLGHPVVLVGKPFCSGPIAGQPRLKKRPLFLRIPAGSGTSWVSARLHVLELGRH